MSNQPANNIGKSVHSSTIEQLHVLTSRRKAVLDTIGKHLAAEKAANAKARVRRIEVTTPLQEELKELDAQLTQLLLTRKKGLWARFGKTIRLPDAVIRYRTDAKSLDTPKNTAAIIKFLRNMRGGGRYLTWTPSLNRDAITNSSGPLQKKLRPLGVWVGRHAIITIKSTGQDEPTTLDRRRFPNR